MFYRRLREDAPPTMTTTNHVLLGSMILLLSYVALSAAEEMEVENFQFSSLLRGKHISEFPELKIANRLQKYLSDAEAAAQ